MGNSWFVALLSVILKKKTNKKSDLQNDPVPSLSANELESGVITKAQFDSTNLSKNKNQNNNLSEKNQLSKNRKNTVETIDDTDPNALPFDGPAMLNKMADNKRGHVLWFRGVNRVQQQIRVINAFRTSVAQMHGTLNQA